mgnify:CR=1 FL=1
MLTDADGVDTQPGSLLTEGRLSLFCLCVINISHVIHDAIVFRWHRGDQETDAGELWERVRL